MTEKQIIAGNKVIAEYTTLNHLIKHDYDYVVNCFYHSKWDWLMPVVYTCTKQILKDGTIGHTKEELYAKKLYTMHLNNPIESVWLAVVEFIKWHNTQAK